MLRPHDVIEWFKARAEKGQTDLAQLIDGLLVGGQIVIGGAETNVQRAHALLGNRIGRIESIQNATLDPSQVTSFDSAAIAQLIMIARNETFHESTEQALDLALALMVSGTDPAVAIEAVRQRISQMPRF